MAWASTLSALWGWLLVVSFFLPLVLLLTYNAQPRYNPAVRTRTPWGWLGLRRCATRASRAAEHADPKIRDGSLVTNLGYALWVYQKFWLRLFIGACCAIVIVFSLGFLVDRRAVDQPGSSSQPWGILTAMLGFGVIVFSTLTFVGLYRRLNPATFLAVAAEQVLSDNDPLGPDNPWLVTQRLQRQVTQLQDDVYRLWVASPYSEKAAEKSSGRAALFGLWWALQRAKLDLVSPSQDSSLRQAVTGCLVATCSSDWTGLPVCDDVPTPPRDVRQAALRVVVVLAGAATLGLAGLLFYRQDWNSGIEVIKGIFLAVLPAATLFLGIRGLRSGSQRD